MQTQPANNPDGKAPVKDPMREPAERDPNPREPTVKAPADPDHKHEDAQFHGAATNVSDAAIVEAAEGDIEATPQGP